jgi:hypothetical protein
MVHQFPGFKERYPDTPISFRDELKYLMTQSAISRFQQMKDETEAINQNDAKQVVEGITKLAASVDEEIDLDIKCYKTAFAA